jgi:spore coat polysaccharide biosynthesis predicted glycosyltransferase SpsG
MRGIAVETIGAPPGSAGDAASLVGIAARAADLVLLDGYQLGDDYESRLVRAGVPFAVMDDHRHAAHAGAVAIVNGNANALPPWSYQDANPSARLLLGPEFAPLRSEFTALREQKRESAEVLRALVSLGENDAKGFLEPVLEALGTMLPSETEIWATAASADAPSPASSGSPGSVRWLTDPSRLPELMATADLAVSAGGMTSYELACLGVPCIVVPVGASQAADAEAFRAPRGGHHRRIW